MRRFLRGAGWACIGTGAFVLYFLVYQLVGTSAAAGKSQVDLRRSLERQWTAQAGGPVAASKPAKPPPPQRVPRGRAFALIQIPAIGVERVMVEGVGRDDLRKGPGHVPGTVMPGQPGTLAVSGHRTTYSARQRLIVFGDLASSVPSRSAAAA